MKHIHLDSTASTQDYLFNYLTQNHEEEELLISASHQTHGKGRGVNTWHEVDLSLFCSFTFPANSVITFTSIEMAVLIHDFFLEHYKTNIFLKWPNDLYSLEGKKIGGILIQKKGDTPYVVGIGLNLYIKNAGKSQYAAIFDSPIADSKALCLQLYQYIKEHRLPNDQLKNTWIKNCLHLNKQVSIHDVTEIQGSFIGIDDSGAALIMDSQGKTNRYYNGSLVIL
jgi:BirA family biotin operon repressor/biotin-[acetyl-CoA-carboxylase] ligase